jgi:hypothetical protein
VVVATSLNEVSATPGIELAIASHVLLASLEATSSSASISSAASGALITIVPLYRLESQLH